MRRNIFLFMGLCALLAVATQVRGVGAADDVSEGGKYVGAKSCKKCHIKK